MSRTRSSTSWYKSAAAGAGLLALAACGFQPLYGRSGQTTAVAELQTIHVQETISRDGQILRNRLIERLNPRAIPAEVRYSLTLEVAQTKVGLAIQADARITRYNLTMTAKYGLKRLSDNHVLINGHARVIGAYNVVDSEYATLVAEKNAVERVARELSDEIHTRLSAYFISAEAKAARDG